MIIMKGLGKILIVGAIGLGAILLASSSAQAEETGSGSLGGADSPNTGTDGLTGLTIQTVFPENPVQFTEPVIDPVINHTASIVPNTQLIPFSSTSDAVLVNGIVMGFQDSARGQSIPLANAITENTYYLTNAGSTEKGTYNASTGTFINEQGQVYSVAPSAVTAKNVTNKSGATVPNVFNLPVSVTKSSSGSSNKSSGSSSKSSTPTTTTKVTTPTTTTKTSTPTTTSKPTTTQSQTTANKYLGVTTNKYFKY